MIGGVTRHMLPRLFGVPHRHVNKPFIVKSSQMCKKSLHLSRQGHLPS